MFFNGILMVILFSTFKCKLENTINFSLSVRLSTSIEQVRGGVDNSHH